MKNIAYVGTSLALVSIVAVLLFVLFSVPTVERSVKTVPQVEPAIAVITYDECIADAEGKYRSYILQNGSVTKDSYGNTKYKLPSQNQWDTINRVRADEYSKCFNRYY